MGEIFYLYKFTVDKLLARIHKPEVVFTEYLQNFTIFFFAFMIIIIFIWRNKKIIKIQSVVEVFSFVSLPTSAFKFVEKMFS